MVQNTFEVIVYENTIPIPFEVVFNEGVFGVKRNGVLIAEIHNNEDWEQKSGDPLDGHVLEQLIKGIKTYSE